MDYAYTLQGWLKGVNGNALVPGTEQGNDGESIGRDALAYTLGYYPGDYKSIVATPAYQMSWQPGGVTGNPLYNGNISNSTVAIKGIGSGNPSGYTYGYDQLNRLVKMRQHALSSSTTTWNSSSISPNDAYKEDISYDGNGNILTYLRNGTSANPVMDNLTYQYNRDGNNKLTDNRLNYITDAASASSYSEDLKSQSANNYTYDEIGNLIKDTQGGITGISWNVYGKIKQIEKPGGGNNNISYTYDPSGNRVSKTTGGLTTWYVRDAQGNSLGVYDNKSGGVNWREQQLYGSSRLGMWKPNFNLATDSAGVKWSSAGLKFFELNNHLGNVLAVISDSRSLAGGFQEPDVLSAQDYYPFGMIQPGRNYSSESYRYGFNGKENDNEVKGTGNQQDYGMRIYDPRIGKFMSVDPITNSYPELTPYQFASNTPIWAIDVDGLEGGIASPMGGQNVVSSGDARKIAGWFSEPASIWMKKGLAAQMNAIQPAEVYNVNSFPTLTKGQYIFASMAQAQINHGDPGNMVASANYKRLPQQPHVEVEANVGKPKIIVEISREKYPESAAHIEEAQAAGQPAILTVDRSAAKPNRKASLKGISTKPWYDRDEYPPAMFKEGGKGASVKYVAPGDNRGAGSSMGNQLKDIPDGTKVQIKIKEKEI